MVGAWLNRSVRRPERAEARAAANPAGPVPATITSYSDSIGEGSLVSKGAKEVVLVMVGEIDPRCSRWQIVFSLSLDACPRGVPCFLGPNWAICPSTDVA